MTEYARSPQQLFIEDVMNRISIILCIATLGALGSPALADDNAWEKIVFVPPKANETALTVNYETGEKNPVLAGILGAPPKDCPPKSFWMLDSEKIVNCGNGSVYRLTKYTGAIEKFSDSFSLIPAKKPKPGTDDPGPSIQKDLEN